MVGRTKQKLTPCSTVTLQKLTVAHLLKIHPTSYVKRRLVSTFKTARHWPLPGALRRNPRPHVYFCKIHLTLSAHLRLNLPHRFPNKNFVSSFLSIRTYRGADKSLARPRRKQANVSVIMAWISFGALPCRKKNWWQLASWCWNRARPWHSSELVSFLVGLRTYPHPGIYLLHGAESLLRS